MVADLADRAEEIRAGNVDPTEDNMLKVTNDGRKLALDQRLIDPICPKTPTIKSTPAPRMCTVSGTIPTEKRLTQLVFLRLIHPETGRL